MERDMKNEIKSDQNYVYRFHCKLSVLEDIMQVAVLNTTHLFCITNVISEVCGLICCLLLITSYRHQCTECSLCCNWGYSTCQSIYCAGFVFHTVKKLYRVVRVSESNTVCVCVAISSVDFVIHLRGKEMKVKGQGLRYTPLSFLLKLFQICRIRPLTT